MLRIFNGGLTVLKNCSFHNVCGIILSAGANKSYVFNSLQDQLYVKLSSAATKNLFSDQEKSKESLQHSDAGEKRELFLSDSALFNVDDIPVETLESSKQKTTEITNKNVLKEDNLELFKEIANGDNDVFQLLKELQVRLDVTSAQYGIKVQLQKEDWIDFMNHSSSKRRSFVAHSIINTIRLIKRKYEQAVSLYDLPCSEEEDDPGFINDYDVRCYHLFHNSMFLKLRPSAIKKMHYAKSFTAFLHSSCIVFDCSYNSLMSSVEIKDLARQIIASIGLNIRSEQPYHVMLCNFNRKDRLASYLEKFNPLIFTDEYPITVTEKSYLELFPVANLVYLTPHCNSSLKSYNSDMTYIVGAFVDKTSKKPISLAKAKEMNLAMAKFPLDEFLKWGLGNKCLSLPHVISIMLNLKIYEGNWDKALEVIPKRFLEKTKRNGNKNSLEAEIGNLFNEMAN